jgi:hypothetical protein
MVVALSCVLAVAILVDFGRWEEVEQNEREHYENVPVLIKYQSVFP